MNVDVHPIKSQAGAGALRDRAREIAAYAARFANSVDREARFPVEAFEALKKAKMMSAFVPVELGGEGATITQIADVCHILGRSCSAAAMIYAMHQAIVASVVFHELEVEWQRTLLKRLVSDQLLFASATTEAGIGGDIRRSLCALEVKDNTFSVTKDASVISYGNEADAILVTARRDPLAAASDQVATIVMKEDYHLEPSASWDTLGMRGTCSEGFKLQATGDMRQVFIEPYSELLARTGMPLAHLLWSSVWLGIATDAVTRARAFVRSKAHEKSSGMSPGSILLAESVSQLHTITSTLVLALQRYDANCHSPAMISSGSSTISLNGLKVAASQIAVQVVGAALHVCGLAGYRNDSEFTVCRHLRDILSAPLMIHNDRIVANNANLLLLHRMPIDLFD